MSVTFSSMQGNLLNSTSYDTESGSGMLLLFHHGKACDHTIGQMDMKFEKKGKCWRSSLYFATIS
ncbi:hypothetical protein NC653_027419 [Populus alba x Populus x berolinensis]|uniref:Uncharacterized protein n=1 Tax=Populus alba x Populus x berolinensis TaxID=444605 RepID=A0AAD6M5X4_9ROSI|nr:hypothetical protein NC653_027419 [Populus alba x Populus x berolinensis]